MEAKAKVKYLRISPRKVRPVIDLVRGLDVEDALDRLKNMNQKAAKFAYELIKSAKANAIDKEMSVETLFVKEIKADGGPSLKRIMPRSMGRADRILKRTAHIEVTLAEKQEVLNK